MVTSWPFLVTDKVPQALPGIQAPPAAEKFVYLASFIFYPTPSPPAFGRGFVDFGQDFFNIDSLPIFP